MRLLLAAACLCFAPTAATALKRQNESDGRCAALTARGTPTLEVLSASHLAPGTFRAPNGSEIAVPASCRIVAVAHPTEDSQIGFELWLPDAWTGRYSQLGNGGFAGNIDQPSLAAEIRRGNAVAMTDTGHKGSQFEASWARGHPQKIVDYGYRSIKVTADASKALIAHYYGLPARRRYFIGCSNGGRQALMAAQRYPGDWDGIIAGSPAVQWTKQLATYAVMQHRLRSAAGNWIPASKIRLIQRAAAAECMSRDASKPCRLDVRALRCADADSPGCLTSAQGLSLDLIQSGPRDDRGRALFYGFDPRSALVPGNWESWILNADRNAPSHLAFATQAYRHFLSERLGWQPEDFQHGRDFDRLSRHKLGGRSLTSILDADNADLSAFARSGGKMILYVGTLDAVITPRQGVDYYRRVAQRMGGIARTQSFFRMFVVPGMQHCQGGVAPDSFGQAWVAPPLQPDTRHDVRRALEAWVEGGRPPRSIIAAQFDESGRKVRATQELRPYPALPGPVRRVAPRRP